MGRVERVWGEQEEKRKKERTEGWEERGRKGIFRSLKF